jgi:hypothetical protein
MVQKMLFGFANIFSKNLLRILGYRFCAECHILAHFHETLLSLKASKIICIRATLFWHQKY